LYAKLIIRENGKIKFINEMMTLKKIWKERWKVMEETKFW
jgi:hypothetical protein